MRTWASGAVRSGVIAILLGVGGLTAASGADRGIGRALAETHWVSYAPTNYFPGESPPVVPSEESLTADLKVLRAAGFNGLVTYSSEIDHLSEIAWRVGFRSLLPGIWDPSNLRERNNVVRAVREHGSFVAGVIVGNEGIQDGRYGLDALCQAMAEIRRATNRPISTTEPVDWILSEPRLAACSDFISVNAHPYFSNRRQPADAVEWTTSAWNAIRRLYRQAAFFKEVGLPTATDSETGEENQLAYYTLLTRTDVVFSWFEAFDATARFKEGLIEQSWGLWRSDRSPKLVVGSLSWRSHSK